VITVTGSGGPFQSQRIDLGAAVGAVMFTVTGGRIRVLGFFGTVTAAIGAVATSIRIDANPTVGADTALCAAGVITAAPAGSMAALTGVVADLLQVNLATQGALRDMTTPLVVQPGTIDLVVTVGGTTGTITWYMLWQPLDAGVVVTES
jgi:hypothetical protein